MRKKTEKNCADIVGVSPMKATAMGDSGSLSRGLQLLSIMGEAGRPLTLSEISESVELASSTTHRLLQTMIQCRYVYKNTRGRYCLAPRALFPLTLNHPLQMLRRDAADILKGLQNRYGPSVLLVVFLGKQRMAIDFAAGNYSVAPYFDTYISAPEHASVSGKIMLADMASEQRDEVLGTEPYAARTRYTIVSRSTLDAELELVGQQGYATNFNENVAGICAIGACLSAPSGRALGAIVMTGPAEYFPPEKLEQIADDVCDTARRLSATSMSIRSVACFLDI